MSQKETPTELEAAMRIALPEDTEPIFKRINTRQEVVVRDLYFMTTAVFSDYAMGPYYLKIDSDGSYFIRGTDKRTGKVRDFRIRKPKEGQPDGVVEIRSPEESWFAPSFEGIRIMLTNA